MVEKDNKDAKTTVSVDALLKRIREIDAEKQRAIADFYKQKAELVNQVKTAMQDIRLLDEKAPVADTRKRRKLETKIPIPEALKQSLPKKGGKAKTVSDMKTEVDDLCGCDVPKANIAAALSKMFKQRQVLRPEEGKYTLP